MTAVRTYRDLEVWQAAMDLSVAIYRLTQSFPRQEVFGLSGQMRRSAVSIPSNIAQGQGRLNTKEFAHFLGIARGSNYELQTQLQIARTLDFGEKKLIAQAEELSYRIERMTNKLLSALRSRIATK